MQVDYAESHFLTEALERRVSRLLRSVPDVGSVANSLGGQSRGSSYKERAAVKSAQHDSLLWIYRNSVDHEFREPGYPWPFPETDIPHYIHMTDAGPQLGSRRETWELSYPICWLEDLVRCVLAGLSTHCDAHGLSPYDAYQFGSLW